MGSHFDSWTDVTGPVYMGAGTSMELVWTAVAAGLCILALIVGGLHENDAYRRATNGDNGNNPRG